MVRKSYLIASVICAFSLFLPDANSATTFSMDGTSSVSYSDDYVRGTGGDLQVLLVDSLTSGSRLKFETDGDSLKRIEWFGYQNPGEDIGLSTVDNVGKEVTLDVAPNLDYGYRVRYVADGDTVNRYVWLVKYGRVAEVTWRRDTVYCERLPLHISPTMFYQTLIKDFKNCVRHSLNFGYDVFKMESGDTIRSASFYQTGDSVFYISEIPTVNTTFEISDEDHGYKFETDTFYTKAVNAFPTLTTSVKHDNEIDGTYDEDADGNAVYRFGESSSFRSSAPLFINLKANLSPGAGNNVWEIYSDSSYSRLRTRFYNRPSLYNYEFRQAGTYCIRFYVTNADSTCDYETRGCFTIENSQLLVPNAFSPNGDGVYDEFKVAYKSLSSYECRIYNQWGCKVFDSDDPAEGWNGTDHGSDCPTGVYFYVIKAKGTDGTSYNKNGSINLLRSAD